MQDPIYSARQRTQRYWYVDGLVEIGAGTVILLLAAFTGLISLAGGNTPTALAIGIGQPVIIIIGTLLVRRIVAALKQRITYPRTGYVAYREPHGRQRLIRGLATGLLALGLAGSLVLLGRQLNERWIPVITATVIAAAMLYIGARFQLVRFYLQALFAFGAGLLVAWLNLSDLLSSAAFFGLLGMSWVVSGGATLGSYLRRTQPAAEEAP